MRCQFDYGGAANELGMAGAVRFAGLDESRVLVAGLLTLVSVVNIAVWFVLYGELPVPPTGAAGSASGVGMMLLFCAAYVFGAAPSGRFCHAPTFSGSACSTPGWSSVPGRTVGGDRGRDRFCGAVGDPPAPARYTDRGGNDRECRVGDRAADRDRGMPVVVCGADQALSRQNQASNFCYGDFGLLRCRCRPAFAACFWNFMARFAWCWPSPSQALPAFWRF